MKSDPNQPTGTPEATPSPSEGVGPLPSIIVDPSLGRDSDSAPAAASSEGIAAAPEPMVAPQGPLAPAAEEPDRLDIAPPPPGFDPAQGPINFDEAERFASSFRPSWEPVAPSSAATVTFGHEPKAAAVPGPTPAPAPDDDVPITAVLGKRNKRRAMLLTAGAVGFFALMLVLALRNSTPDKPTQMAATPAASDAPEPASQATAAEPAPAPTPEAVPAAAAPAEAPTVAPEPTTAPAAEPPTPGEPPTPAAAAAEPTPAPAAAEPAPPVPEPEPPAPPPVVRVRVSTSPAVATLTLDGAPVANPLDASFPKGGQHSLAASAVGHQSVTKTVSFDRDVKVSLQLRPEPVRRAAAPVARPVRPAPPPPQRAAPPPPVLTIQKQPAPAKKTKGAGFVADSPY